MSRRGWWILGGVVGAWVLVLVVIAAVAVGTVAGIGVADRWDERVVMGEGPQKVAMISIVGEIHTGESPPGFYATSTGSADVLSQIRQAEEDDDVAAVLLRLETPGGGVVASDEISRGLLRLREEKPLVASMGDMAASGGYYLAAAAERVVANPATLTGSIGVIMIIPNLEGTAEKLGIRPIVLKAGEFKDAGSPFRDLTPTEQQHFQTLLDEAHTQFIDAIATGRGIGAAQVRPHATGRVFTGRQALELELVDELGDLDDAYAQALELAQLDPEEAVLVEYRARPGLGGFFPPFFRSPVEEVRQELGIGFGLKYLYLP